MLASLTDDVNVLTSAIQDIPQLIINSAVLVGCAAYLAWLSWHAAALMIAIVLLGGLSYRLFLTRAQTAFEAARDGRDACFATFVPLPRGSRS